MNKILTLLVLLGTSFMLAACTSTDYILIDRTGGGSLAGNNETGYSIHACGGANCEVGFYSMAS